MNSYIWMFLASATLAWAPVSQAVSVRLKGTVTQALQRSIEVPSGYSVMVENLAGHVRVVQGDGRMQVTAEVVAGGDQANALVQSVKLHVSTVGKQIQVRVLYPVDQYDTFQYLPPDAPANGSHEICFRGNLVCMPGRSSSTFNYQDKRIRINESVDSGSGVPLHADVLVRLPMHVSAIIRNAVGLLEVQGLASDLNLVTEGGGIYIKKFAGRLDAHSDGGDIYLSGVTSPKARLFSGGGDITADSLSGDFDLVTSGGDAQVGALGETLASASSGRSTNLASSLSTLKLFNVETGGGDLMVAGDLAALTSLDVQTSGGDIEFLASHLSMHLEAHSGGGDINVRLPGMRNVSKTSDYFSGDIGKATGTGKLSSGGGDITLRD